MARGDRSGTAFSASGGVVIDVGGSVTSARPPSALLPAGRVVVYKEQAAKSCALTSLRGLSTLFIVESGCLLQRGG